MTVKLTSASIPNRDGTASRCASSVSSKNALGDPLVSTIGTDEDVRLRTGGSAADAHR